MFLNFVCRLVEEIFQTYLQSSKEELTDAIQKLKEMTPAPMNSMLDKQPREDALQKRSERSSMVVSDVPPTTPGIFSIASVMSEKRGKHSENWRNLESQKHCGHYMTSCLVSLFVKCCYSGEKNKGLTDKNVISSLVSQVPQATRRTGGDIPSTRARPTAHFANSQ